MWPVHSPSTPTIRVRILLKSAILLCKHCLKRTIINEIEAERTVRFIGDLN